MREATWYSPMWKKKSDRWAVARWLAYPEPECPPRLGTTDVAGPATRTQGQYGKRPVRQGSQDGTRITGDHHPCVNPHGTH